MAKQLVNPVERHVEKAVLGIAGLLLIGVVVRYLVTTPNQSELGGEPVSPGTIDAKLAQKAAAVRERIRRAKPEEDTPEPLYKEFLEGLDPYAHAQAALNLPVTVAIGPEVPVIEKAQAGPGGSQLVKVVPMLRPAATHGRSTFQLMERDGTEIYRPANWVTVSAVFDVKAQMAEQRRQYGAMRKEVVFGRAQLQRRARRDDGSWSDDDWEDVQLWSSLLDKLPAPPRVMLVKEEDSGRLVVPRQIRSAVEDFFDALREPRLQLKLLRPLLPPIANGDSWSFPVLTTYRDVLIQDDYYLHPDLPPATDPEDRYRQQEAVSPAPVDVMTAADRLDEARRLLEDARTNLVLNNAVKAYNIAFDIERDEDVGAADRKAASKLKAEADFAMTDIKRLLRAGAARTRRPTTPRDEERPKREPVPIQQVWIHDAGPESVKSGTTYQYRLRPTVYNRLAAQADKFRDPLDAATLFISGEWTDPVEVTVEPDTYFFVTGGVKRKGMVSVEFYEWFEGIWVKSRFKFGVGDALRREQRVEVRSLDDPGATEKALVEFAADASVVDIDFERTYRARKKGTSRAGVRFGPPSTACCVVLADSAGRLHERFVDTDKGHPDRRAVRARVWVPPRQD